MGAILWVDRKTCCDFHCDGEQRENNAFCFCLPLIGWQCLWKKNKAHTCLWIRVGNCYWSNKIELMVNLNYAIFLYSKCLITCFNTIYPEAKLSPSNNLNNLSYAWTLKSLFIFTWKPRAAIFSDEEAEKIMNFETKTVVPTFRFKALMEIWSRYLVSTKLSFLAGWIYFLWILSCIRLFLSYLS